VRVAKFCTLCFLCTYLFLVGTRSLQQSEVISSVFWFGQPHLYFESIQLMFMVIAFYVALWLTVMVSAAPTQLWKFLSILPTLLICTFFFQIVKTAALLKAVYEVDSDALLEVIEETEAAKQLSDELREKVISHLNCEGEDAYTELARLYRVIDANGNDALSRSEFGEFMSLMEISFSAKKWERIFKEIDRNYDNDISLQEFFLFLFPDHDLALKLEMRRLKVISQRVMSRANKVLSHLSPFREVKLVSSPSKLTSDLSMSLQAVSKFKKSVRNLRTGDGAHVGTGETVPPQSGGSEQPKSMVSAALSAVRSMRPGSASVTRPIAAAAASGSPGGSAKLCRAAVVPVAEVLSLSPDNGDADVEQQEHSETAGEDVRRFDTATPTAIIDEHHRTTTEDTPASDAAVAQSAVQAALLEQVAFRPIQSEGEEEGEGEGDEDQDSRDGEAAGAVVPQPFLEHAGHHASLAVGHEAGREAEAMDLELGDLLRSNDSPDPDAQGVEEGNVDPDEAATSADF
jgi:hypothetical protein